MLTIRAMSEGTGYASRHLETIMRKANVSLANGKAVARNGSDFVGKSTRMTLKRCVKAVIP